MNREAERKRLVEILKENCHCKGDDCTQCRSNGLCFTQREADHLLDNGIVVPPAKVGQTVYCIVDGMTKVMEGRVRYIWILEDGSQKLDTLIKGYFPQRYTPEDFGKTVFLTREQAEKALEGKGE